MENKQTSLDLDLDTLTGKSKKVKLGGRIIEIFPPSLEELFNLQELASKFRGFDKDSLTDEDAMQVFAELQEGFLKLIPGLESVLKKQKGFKGFLSRLFKKEGSKGSLTAPQMFALLDLIVEMSIPADMKELEKQGIKLDSEQKKILSDRSRR